MTWRRLALRMDRRFVIASAGAAMAILLPVAATLVLAGLDPHVDAADGWILVAPSIEGLPLDGPGVRAVAVSDGVHFATFADLDVGVGEGAVLPGHEAAAMALGLAPVPGGVSSSSRTTPSW